MFNADQIITQFNRASLNRDDDDNYLVIGIDFGTTFSGVSWATQADFDKGQFNVITAWPDTGREEGKAPTELSYESSELEWGFGIHPEAEPVRWFKLLLLKEEDMDPETRQHEYILRARRQLSENDKSAIDLIADYLRSLWQHTLESISRARGESVVESLPFHIVLTVPAIWKGYARQAMEKAAQKAGMLDRRPAGKSILSFAPEPEAAALSTLNELGQTVQSGDVYLVCDAGGGTVDLITYRVNSVNPIRMEEAVEGTGGLCGGIFIDEAFAHMCKQRLGRKWNKISPAGAKELLTSEWQESIKPQFKPGNTNKEYTVRVPTEAFANDSQDDLSREPYIKRGRIHFKSAHIQQAFTKVFLGINELIDAQLKKASEQDLRVTSIILVGGLGGSPYLFEHLKSRYAISNINILQSRGMNPRTAICRGAVLKGFLDGVSGPLGEDRPGVLPPISVTSTVARMSLGVVFQANWDDKIHSVDQDKKVWDDDDGVWRADSQLEWYLKRGKNVPKLTPVTHSFCQKYGSDFGGKFAVSIRSCEDEIPPTRETKNVEDFCTIDCVLDVPFSSLKDHHRPDGKVVKRLDFDVQMIPSGATVEFAVLVDGRKLGKKNANVDFQ